MWRRDRRLDALAFRWPAVFLEKLGFARSMGKMVLAYLRMIPSDVLVEVGRMGYIYLCELLCLRERFIDFGSEVLVGFEDCAVRHGGGIM